MQIKLIEPTIYSSSTRYSKNIPDKVNVISTKNHIPESDNISFCSSSSSINVSNTMKLLVKCRASRNPKLPSHFECNPDLIATNITSLLTETARSAKLDNSRIDKICINQNKPYFYEGINTYPTIFALIPPDIDYEDCVFIRNNSIVGELYGTVYDAQIEKSTLKRLVQ